MRDFIIVGRPNSGKTLFALNFASFLGSKTVDVTSRSYDNLVTCKHYQIDEAKKALCGPMPHKTQSIQTIILSASVGKNSVNFKISDTCGITEGIHTNVAIRKGMAQTIHQMLNADFIFHVFDLSSIEKGVNYKHSAIDEEIYNYGISRMHYTLLANKIDLISPKDLLSKLITFFPKATIIPISALLHNGFKEVKACVIRNI